MKTDELKYSYMKNIFNKFAVSLPQLIIITILMGFLLAGIIGRQDLAVRGLIIGIPAIISAKLLHTIYKNELNLKNINISFSLTQKQLTYLFFIVYFSSLIIVFISSYRTWLYLIVISLLYFIILLQTFSTDFNPNFILLQTALCMLNLIYSVTLKYPLYFGGTDILGHIFLSQATYISGHIIPEELGINYAHFPLFHILMSQSAYILGLDMKTSYFLISAPLFTLSSLFVYQISLNVTKNTKLSLLTTILYSTQSIVIYYGMYVITRVAAFIGFLIILNIIFKNKNNIYFKFIGIILTLFIILVHQVSSPQILTIALLLFISEKFVIYCTNIKENYWGTTYISMFTVIFLAYWLYLAYSFTHMLLTTQFDSLTTPIQIKGSIRAGNELTFLYTNINNMVLIFFIIIGIGVNLWKSEKDYSTVFAFASLLFLPLYLPNPLQTLWQTMNLFRFDRFILLISPFIAFSMASGVFFLYNFLKSKHIKHLYIILLIFILLIVFIISSLIVNNPEASSIDDRRYFTSEELTSFKYVQNYVTNDSYLYSDYFTKHYFYTNFNESDKLALTYYNNSRTIDSIDYINFLNGYFILRDKAFLEKGLELGGEGSKYYITKYDLTEWNELNSELNKKDKIYSSSCVSIYCII